MSRRPGLQFGTPPAAPILRLCLASNSQSLVLPLCRLGQCRALIHDPADAAAQAVHLAGRPNLHSICVHGDSPDAVPIAEAVRRALETAGFTLAPFTLATR
eukprot:SAG22_NODE_590_length_8826_cov_6.627134_7_plen_101_part_00